MKALISEVLQPLHHPHDLRTQLFREDFLRIFYLYTDIFRQKHKEAKERIKFYNNDLTKLLKMYEKEKR